MSTNHDKTRWFTSSRSGGANPDCVEVRFTSAGIDVRDSKNPHTAHLTFNRTTWAKFLHRHAK